MSGQIEADAGRGGVALKKVWKDALNQAYRTPEPKRKAEFLSKLTEPEMSGKDFIISQLGYIRKWNWLLAFVLFGIAVFGGIVKEPAIVRALSALTPFLALSAVAESSRSLRFQMDELEMSGRFTLRAVIMARMTILGVGNLILLGIICPVLLWQRQAAFLYVGISVLIPYLLTSLCSLFIVRRIRDKESLYYCSGVTVLVCGLQLLIEVAGIRIYELFKPAGWLGVLAVLLALTGRECLKMLKQTEDYAWNL